MSLLLQRDSEACTRSNARHQTLVYILVIDTKLIIQGLSVMYLIVQVTVFVLFAQNVQ